MQHQERTNNMSVFKKFEVHNFFYDNSVFRVFLFLIGSLAFGLYEFNDLNYWLFVFIETVTISFFTKANYDYFSHIKTKMIVTVTDVELKVKRLDKNNVSQPILTIKNNDIEDIIYQEKQPFPLIIVIQKSTGIHHKIEIHNLKTKDNFKELFKNLSEHYHLSDKKESIEEQYEVSTPIKLRSFKKNQNLIDIKLEDINRGSVINVATEEYIISEVNQLDFKNTTTHFVYNLEESEQTLLIYPTFGFLMICIEEMKKGLLINIKLSIVYYEGDEYVIFEKLEGKIHNSLQKFIDIKQYFFTTKDYSKSIRVLEINEEYTYFIGERKYLSQVTNVLSPIES
ncbi:hypothetical protein [Flammeovirga kamogawensis]|nr:hypothetical protein [Flammeovirga kamogawensis]MBB6460512.1 hypothetical protein [Flammeovirga kamogawensis]TRX64764.1 hypothetical protein EO216_19695 [Flammeovirga kamogawensis]